MFSHSKKLRRWIFIWMFVFFFLSLQHALITTEWLTGLRWREEEVGHARQRLIKERERRWAEHTKKSRKSEKCILQSLPRRGFSFGAQISTPTPLQKPDCVRLKSRGADFTKRAQLNVWVRVKQTHICFLSTAGQETNKVRLPPVGNASKNLILTKGYRTHLTPLVGHK